MDTGDTAFILVASALVMFMTPGLALFYGGLVRQKNVLSTIMHSFVALGVISIVWFVAGYALGFGPDRWGGLIGGGDYYGLAGVSFTEPGPFASSIPHGGYMVFQLMFAIITPALISGAFAERIKFGGYVAFIVLWSLFVYSPIAHWVWGGGWLGGRGVLDFAGGTVVHINAGVAALAFAIYLGKRKGWPKDVAPPHNVPMTVLGAAILWFGWFGFNAGSQLTAEGAALPFVTTHLGAAAAVVGWALVEKIKHGRVTTVGVATGAVAGLVAITPAAGFVLPWAAMIIGFVAGIVCYLAINLKFRFGYDDSLDVVGVHLVGGMIGALLTGVFAEASLDFLDGSGGGVAGAWGQVGDQLIGIGATIGFSLVVSLLILVVVDKTIGLRVGDEDEVGGLDLALHSESAYSTADVSTTAGAPSPVSGGQDRPAGPLG
ncbi:MAG TPA: ammonium transporter [Actinomycetota bacterium]